MESVGEESGIRRLMMANNTMNDENKKKLQAVQEDDNPIIVKYQIKK